MENRSNIKIEEAVRSGILASAYTEDFSSVVKKMIVDGVPVNVIRRIFVDPQTCRASDLTTTEHL